MKKLLNTLYVTTQEAYLRKEGETVVVEKEKQVLLRLPIHTLQGIVTFGNVMTSLFPGARWRVWGWIRRSDFSMKCDRDGRGLLWT